MGSAKITTNIEGVRGLVSEQSENLSLSTACSCAAQRVRGGLHAKYASSFIDPCIIDYSSPSKTAAEVQPYGVSQLPFNYDEARHGGPEGVG